MIKIVPVRYVMFFAFGLLLCGLALKLFLDLGTMRIMNENTDVSGGDSARSVPPVQVPTEGIKSIAREELGVFELPMNQAVSIADFTATLVDNNHKFQDNPYDSYVWVTIKIVLSSGETHDIVLNYQTYKGDDGTVKVMNEPTVFGGYEFTPLDIGYDYYVKVRVAKQVGV